MSTGFLRTALSTALVVVAAHGAFAHPTSLTSVTVVAGHSAADVTIDTDERALELKLQALGRSLVDCLDLRADGVRLSLAPLREPVGGSRDETPVGDREGGTVKLRLHASLPPETRTISFGSSCVYGSYPVVFRRAGDSQDHTQWLQGAESSAPFAIAGPASTSTRHLRRFAEAIALGFTHILPGGFDHVLFVLGLFFLTTRVSALLAQVTAFTLAHSITLGLTLFGCVSLPASIVEPAIALSIAYVAFENLFTSDLKPWRLVLVFAFGLLHGMGFADALVRLDLPRSEILTTLVGFNLGVEGGQLAIIAAASIVASGWALSPDRYRRLVVRPASAAIGVAGLLWTLQRL